QAADGAALSALLEMLNQLVTELSAFAGLIHDSMTRTQAWRFLELGRQLELAWQTTFLLRHTIVRTSEREASVLEAILRTLDSFMTYRIRYPFAVQAAPALDLMLTDESNPRAIGFQIARIVEHVENLPRDSQSAVRGPEQKLVLSLQNSLRLADVFELTRCHASGDRNTLRRFLGRVTEQLQRLSDLVTSRYLIHAGLPRHFAAPMRGR
ncbi:MAG TPA: alpha-E domain-containing protein, partial [Pirellulaceae bacterium]